MKQTRPAPPKLEQRFKRLREKLPDLRARYGLLKISAFGSRVRNKERGNSDLDLLAEFGESEISLFEFVRLEQELSELLGIKVDLVEKDSLKPAIGRRILEEARPI